MKSTAFDELQEMDTAPPAGAVVEDEEEEDFNTTLLLQQIEEREMQPEEWQIDAAMRFRHEAQMPFMTREEIISELIEQRAIESCFKQPVQANAETTREPSSDDSEAAQN